MKRFGTVIRFKEGVTREEAVEALYAISHLIEIPHSRQTTIQEGANLRGLVAPSLDDLVGDIIREYDDNEGGPIWYIP